MKGKQRQYGLFIVLVALLIWLSGCGLNLKELAPVEAGPRESNWRSKLDGDLHKLIFVEKLNSVPDNISAIGTNGTGSYLYFGSKTEPNLLYVFDLRTNNFTGIETKVKDHKHSKKGYYDAASSLNSFTNNPPDETVITSIVSGPKDTAVFSLTGLLHRQGGVYGTAAHGGVLEIDKNSVTGVWGNIIGSLNSGDAKEISTIAVVKDSWIAFSSDKNSIGAYRKFGDKLDQAEEGPTGINGDPIGTIVTASLGVGTDLYIAYDGFVKLRHTDELEKICVIDLGREAQDLIDVAKPKDLQITQGGSDVIIINSLGLLGRKLLVGMTSYSQYSGGVAVVDLSLSPFNVIAPPLEQSGMSIKHIAPAKDGMSALISTNSKGFIFYADDEMIKISNHNFQDFTRENLSIAQPLLIENAREASHKGFRPSEVDVGAVQIGDFWYVATSRHGIFKFQYVREKY
ncbi:MAG: hypothetical protein KC505_00145 [Myxococcales bacterium]|nr:hypothetical protein [Myxococcales bacterium]USN51082.1 MAG: hypothetical protein H6731_01340 [Myxococcales bacterium]